ncbi:MAG: TonB-dependent receptor domain-containing protein [Candidatus Methylacidiphilales bacterium]
MKKITNSILLILTLISFSSFSYAQNGKISGKIFDNKNGEVLIGAKVVIEGTITAASSDYEGKFTLANVAPGTYNLVISYLGYSKKIISNVEVKKGEVTNVSISMVESVKGFGDVVIRGEVKKESANALLIQQKNATTISDGVSIETIRKTPDRNTSDVLKRVSGATIQDGKYAIIRGLPDRYNAAFINGAPLPSSEPDRKAFAFDIFPANLLDNIVIVKSATPDLPGEFAGGLILIKTKDIPDQNFYNVSFGTSINTLTTFNKFNTNVKGSTDFLGIDDGKRKLPGSLPDYATMKSYENVQTQEDLTRLVNVAKPFNNNFKINEEASMRPAYTFQFSMGHLKKLKTSELGSVFSASLQNTPTTQQIRRRDYDNNGVIFDYTDEQNTINTLNGFLWNISYKNKNNKISFKNLLNINSNDQTIVRTGQDLINGFTSKSYAMWYTQNVLNSHQVNGEHYIKKYNSKVNWTAGYSGLNRETPDLRRVRYQKVTGSETGVLEVPLTSVAQADVAGRFFSTQNDKIFNAGFDVSRPLNIGKFKNEIKFGASTQIRDRDFKARQLGYRFAPGQNPSQLKGLGVGDIFSSDNISNTGLVLAEVTSPTDAYTASSNLYAGFVRFDSKITSRLKAVWGVRVESYNQKLNTFKTGSTEEFKLDSTVVDFLPSVNFIYTLNTKTNLRASYSQTVSRPEFRELASFTFYDFNDNLLVEGNSELKRTRIHNYDIRYELYPTPAQLVSVSVFYKQFDNPIEKSLTQGGSPKIMGYSNVPSAFSYGFELDYKLNFGQLFRLKNKFLDGLNFIGNLAYIKSEVDVSKVLATSEKTRPLQGQSPYIINAMLQYSNTKKEYGVSLAFNRIGERIVNVGNVEYGSYWENPRSVIDLQINKTFFKKLDVRFGIRDILAQNIIFYQKAIGDSNSSFKPGQDNEIWNFKVGSSYSINLSYKF